MRRVAVTLGCAFSLAVGCGLSADALAPTDSGFGASGSGGGRAMSVTSTTATSFVSAGGGSNAGGAGGAAGAGGDSSVTVGSGGGGTGAQGGAGGALAGTGGAATTSASSSSSGTAGGGGGGVCTPSDPGSTCCPVATCTDLCCTDLNGQLTCALSCTGAVLACDDSADCLPTEYCVAHWKGGSPGHYDAAPHCAQRAGHVDPQSDADSGDYVQCNVAGPVICPAGDSCVEELLFGGGLHGYCSPA